MNLQELTAQLSIYGLNPNEWILYPESEDLFKIQSKEDQGFAFVGKTDPKESKPQWAQIELLSV